VFLSPRRLNRLEESTTGQYAGVGIQMDVGDSGITVTGTLPAAPAEQAGILSGDYIFVRKQLTASRGDIVVALIGDEATVKYYFPEKDYVRFQPANKEMAPILVRAVDFRPTMLLGVVVGVYRRL